MSTITLPNIRVSSDLTVKVRLKDGGVAIDWSTLQNIKAHIYSDAQRALAGRCSVSVDAEDHTLLICTYAANKPQYVGVNRVVVSAKYMGETKTYDKPAFNFVRWTDDQAGEQITIEDPDIDVEISVEDVSSSILQEAVDAAFTAADRANDAAEAAEHMVDIHTGPGGKSAYEVAVEEGYTGTEEEWLASLKGPVGETPDISIGTVTTVEPGTPAAASMSGTPEAPVLNLSIPKGLVGATPNFTIGTVTTGEPGTPVVVTLTGTPEAPVLNLTIPQGMQGNTGSSVDYPFELVNNLTTNDATKALSAAQGVVLDGKISQLEHKVDDLSTGKYYGYFAQEEDLPEEGVDGFAYVGTTSPYTIYNRRDGVWTSSNVTVNQSPIGNDEDIDQNEDGKLQFANRVYNAQQPNGMGYKILRKDATFASQVTDTNTIYEIRYDFSLGGDPFALPNGCVLHFNGGSINNGSLSNVGKTEGATEGSITATISSFSDDVNVIRTSEYSVGVNSAPAFNNAVFQSAINKQIAIVIDTTRNTVNASTLDGFDYGITFAEPLYISRIRVSICGEGKEGGMLYFPNGDAIVYNSALYYSHDFFENLTISAKRYCFNFVNEEEEGVVNSTRPYNISHSIFRNLRLKSLEKDCFYQNGVSGYGGDAAMLFQNLFSNISLWTPRYGFNGINGQTDFVVEHLTDVYVPEAFFYNTFPSVVRYMNSSFSGTKNFMRFGGQLTNYSIKIRCEYCSFETYTGEVFLDTAMSSSPTRNYEVSLYKCGFGYSAATFTSGTVELFPIKLNAIKSFVFHETTLPSIGFKAGFGICWGTSINTIDTDTKIDVYYGYNSQNTYYGYYTANPIVDKRQTIVGTYPNYVIPAETDFIKGNAVMAKMFGFDIQTIDVTSNRVPSVNSSLVVLNASAAAQIDYITPAPLDSLGGVSSQTAYNQFGKFVMFYNNSSVDITFNNGYSNSVVAYDTPFFVMKPKEFAIAVYDFGKSNNRFVVVQRLNEFVKCGNTNQRPTLTAYEAGFTFYDRTLKKMILWEGANWVNMDGTALS